MQKLTLAKNVQGAMYKYAKGGGATHNCGILGTYRSYQEIMYVHVYNHCLSVRKFNIYCFKCSLSSEQE